MEQVLNKTVNNSNPEKYFKLVRNRVKFKLFLLLKLPSAFFSGVMLQSIDQENCHVSVPLKWFSQNPFKSTYFACLSMAAELSTGALGLAHTFEAQPSISMLVVNIEGDFHKKATGITNFICKDGGKMKEAIETSIQTGKGVSVQAISVGTNEAGERIAEFRVTWSFKARSKTV